MSRAKRRIPSISRIEKSFISYGVLTRSVCALLITCMLTLSAPAAPQEVKGYVGNITQSARFYVLSNNFGNRLTNWFPANFKLEKRALRSEDISEIRIFPGSITMPEGSEFVFAAAAYDSQQETLSGIDFEWLITDTEDRMRPKAMEANLFKAEFPGTFRLRASSGGHAAEVTVTVTPVEENEELIKQETKTHRVSTRRGTGTKETVEGRKRSQTTVSNLLPDEYGWNDDNWDSSVEPGNQPGNPPGSPMDDGAGNGNFQISAPVVSLPGRNIDVALNLVYNSRVWNKAGNKITYDINYDDPAPGWSLDFGKIVFMGADGGCMLIDADGTRHGYTGSVNAYSTGMSFKGHTADGSFIDYGCQFTYGEYGSGWVKLPNGTNIIYSTIGPGNSHVHPTRITDVQGNYVTITYQNTTSPSDPKIETVTDTLGRVITFKYDSLNRMIEVVGPAISTSTSGRTRTLMRLHYRELTLGYSFNSGITAMVRDSSPWVIDSIYYPGTNTGYWFGGADSGDPDYDTFYSSYGMLAKVEEHRDMDWTTGMEEQGVIVKGDTTKRASYNYPLTTANVSGRTNGLALTDAPTYTELSEWWAERDVNDDAVTTYSFDNNVYKDDGTSNSPARLVEVTQPNGVISKQYSYRTPGLWMDGLVFTDETIVLNGSTPVVVASSLVSWQQGNYDSPRPSWAKVFDENGKKVKTAYTYTTNKFNQITRSCDYDDSDTLLRCSTADYENGTDYTGSFDTYGDFIYGGKHLFNLVKSSRIEDASGTVVSRADYEYDNYTTFPLTDTPGVIQHDPAYDPFNSDTVSCNCRWECDLSFAKQQPVENSVPECEDGGPPFWTCDQCPIFDSGTNKRGNITKITRYENANSPAGGIDETRSYDITGNAVRISSSCCEETSMLFDDPNTTGIDTQYAYPVSQTRGSSNPSSLDRITTSAAYDFNTGLILEATDANGLTSTTEYDDGTLRPTKMISSTDAYSTMTYDDAAITVTEEVFDDDDNSAGKSKKYLNGIGLVIKEESYNPGGVIDIVETKYTKFAEPWKQSRPYRSGDTIQWSEKFYDLQGRLSKVVEPDGSETKAFYNETTRPSSATTLPGNTTRIVDAWGRERWGRYDQQGRLAEVVEPNPNGDGTVSYSGNLLTEYTYDTLGRLVQTEQGSQIRKFKYDDLGRLTRQKLAEQTATLNAAGAFVGIGHQDALWSEAFVYDDRSNLTMKTDARGVKTHLSYQISGGGDDPLNRIQERSYDLSGTLQPGLTIHAAPTVNYEYMTSGDKGRIKEIRTDGFLTEEYSYDSQSRVSEYKQTIDYRTSYPMTTSYLYDTLDRTTEVHYPAQYGLSGSPRKIVTNSYDSASRLTEMTFGGAVQASDIVYNASDQTTSVKIGASGTNQVTENYTFDQQTGLLTNQTAVMNSTTLLDLSYDYGRNGSIGSSLSGKTGNLTKIVNNLDTNKNREYEFDALGRLTKAKGGTTGTLWDQNYTYDRYGNRTNVAANGVAADSSPIPLDGIPNLAYDTATNRITTTGYEYDAAGNQIRSLAADGVNWLLYEYDAANRIYIVKQDGTTPNNVQSFQYGSTNARLLDYDYGSSQLKIFASIGGTTLAEYTEYTATVPTWTKSYTYFGDTQLATITPNGTGGEYSEFNHPDRLGTKVITNQAGGTSYEQATLPFGTALNAESTGSTNNRFTSYDRSAPTGLDYAINRTYDSKQGRFSQVDPIGMQAVSLSSPQTINLYSYCGNDPINHIDPNGLFFGRFFRWLGHLIMRFFRSGAAKRIAVRFVVNFAVSGGNFGVAVRSVLPDILSQLGLNPNPLLTPSWNPSLRYPISFGIGPLSKYIISNLISTIAAADCRIEAFLSAIMWAEGAGPTSIVRGRVIRASDKSLLGKSNIHISVSDYSNGHPNILVRVRNKFKFPNGKVGPLDSTAAGSFQIIKSTWDRFGGGQDFSPANQEVVATKILSSVGAITKLQGNDFKGATNLASSQWASLPGSTSGQPTQDYIAFENVYLRNKANCEALQSTP